MTNDNKKILPIVFAVDDNYAPFLSVNIRSIIDNGDKNNFYKFYILITELNEQNKARLKVYEKENCEINFINVAERMDAIAHKLALRDYYTLTIYYRLFIPSLFPQYDKILYLDCDMTLCGDIAELFAEDLGDNILGTVREEVMTIVDAFGKYSEECLGVPRQDYFNSGLLLINCKQYKESQIEKGFLDLLNKYKFEVAPDQDYLNVLCKGRVKKLNLGWNKAPIKDDKFKKKDLELVHYKLWYKPWLYSDILYEELFWDTAKKTLYFNDLKEIRSKYGEDKVVRDLLAYKNLVKLALTYANDSKNYFKSERAKINVDA